MSRFHKTPVLASLVTFLIALTPVSLASAEETPQSKEVTPPSRFTFFGDVGVSYQRLIGVPLKSGAFRAGVTVGRFLVFDGEYLRGETEQSLAMNQLRFGLGLQLRRDQLWGGAGVTVGYLEIRRATTPDHWLSDLSAGAKIWFGANFTDDRLSPYFLLRCNVDLYSVPLFIDPSTSWGPTASLGLSFE